MTSLIEEWKQSQHSLREIIDIYRGVSIARWVVMEDGVLITKNDIILLYCIKNTVAVAVCVYYFCCLS